MSHLQDGAMLVVVTQFFNFLYLYCTIFHVPHYLEKGYPSPTHHTWPTLQTHTDTLQVLLTNLGTRACLPPYAVTYII